MEETTLKNQGFSQETNLSYVYLGFDFFPCRVTGEEGQVVPTNRSFIIMIQGPVLVGWLIHKGLKRTLMGV